MRNLWIRAAVVAAGAVAAPLAQAAPPFSWTGYYIGVNGGYGWGSGGGDGTVYPSSIPLAPGYTIVAPAPGPYGFSVDDPKGGFGGIQIGRNWQSDRIVYGIEADFDFASIKGDGSAPILFDVSNPDAGIFRGTATLSQKLEWFATLRGRLGYDFNPVLVYVTGGLAIGHIKSTLDLTGATYDVGGGTPVFVASTSASASDSTTRVGFAIGAGGEWMVSPNWSLRGEYLFISFQNSSDLSVPGVTASSLGMDVQIARAALNYRFGGP